MEDLEYEYDCIVCGEHWETIIELSDYIEDKYWNDNTCPHCNSSFKEAYENKKSYEEQGLFEIVTYFIKRIINSTLLAIRIK